MVGAEFFDIFGFVGFLILLVTGFLIRKKEKVASWVIIGISLIGLIVDGYVIVKSFIIGG